MAALSQGTARDVKVIGMLGFAHLMSHLYFLVLPPILPLLKADLGVSYAALGLIMTGYGIAAGVAQTPMGFLIDRIGGRPVVVTFCPLCGTGMVFHARLPGRELNFGVSGLLYQSDMLLYDRATESLWSQIKKEAVAGPLTGTRLRLIPATQTTWSAWKKKHPDTLVLSTKTGYLRNYDRDPYAGYEQTSSLMFGVTFKKALKVTRYLIEEKGLQVNPKYGETVQAGIKFSDLMSLAEQGGSADPGNQLCREVKEQIAFVDNGGTMVDYESSKIRKEIQGIFYQRLKEAAKKHRC